MNTKTIKWGAIVQVYELFKPFRLILTAALLVQLGFQLLGLAVPFIVGRIIDACNQNASTWTFVMLASLVLVLELAEIPLMLLSHYVNCHKLEFKLIRYLNMFNLQKITSLSLGQISSEHSGFRQSAIDEGMNAIMNIVNLFMAQILPMTIKMIVVLVALFFLHWLVGTVALVSVGFYVLMSIWINNSLLPQIRVMKKMAKGINTRYSDTMRNLPLIMATSQERQVKHELDLQYGEYSEYCIKAWDKYVLLIAPLREPSVRFGLFAIILLAVGLLKKGQITVGEVVTSISWTLILFSNVGNVGNMQRQLMRLGTHVSQYFDIVNTPCDIVMHTNAKKLEMCRGEIEFRNVSFAYKSEEGEQGALHDLSFTVKPGETCAIVGHSGGGKTTTVKLILRAHDPDSGSVYIDGIDLREVDLHSWRHMIGYVEQNVSLWDHTLRYNMLFGTNGRATLFTDEDLHDIARKTCIDRFYDRLGQKRFETLIGENGVKLSGGERQRVGIARALAKDPRVLIFDEATNSLDTVNEVLIQGAIREALKGRTGIIIAHRLSTVRHADKIVVLEKGRKVGEGKHQELLITCPQYRILVESDTMHSL